jgi:hypothetical protein
MECGKHSNTFAVRQELARHFESITLLPEGDAIRYKGKWKLLRDTGGAEGGDRTQRLSVDFRIPIAA